MLSNGKVLVACLNSVGDVTNAELYDPATGTWTTTGLLATGRNFHTTSKLANGKVLVVGGQTSEFNIIFGVELFDPPAGIWATVNSLTTERSVHTSTLLSDGQMLIAGEHKTSGAVLNGEGYDPPSLPPGHWLATNMATLQS